MLPESFPRDIVLYIIFLIYPLSSLLPSSPASPATTFPFLTVLSPPNAPAIMLLPDPPDPYTEPSVNVTIPVYASLKLIGLIGLPFSSSTFTPLAFFVLNSSTTVGVNTISPPAILSPLGLYPHIYISPPAVRPAAVVYPPRNASIKCTRSPRESVTLTPR